MAITFLEKRKKLRTLILILVVVILITLFVLWKGFFAKEEIPPIEIPVGKESKEVKINFQIFKDPLFGELQPFEEIPPLEEPLGRENPFLPH